MRWPQWLTRTRRIQPEEGLQFGYRRPSAQILVTEQTALTYAAFWAAVRLIAETVASLSWHVLQRRADGGSELQADNPVDRLIHTQPNPAMGSFTFRELLQSWVLTWGNGYAEIERDTSGRPMALWPIDPSRVEPMWARGSNSREIVYEITQRTGDAVIFGQRDMLHIKGMNPDGLKGYSVIAIAREALGLGIATERYGGSFFGNSSRPSGVLKYPGKLKPDAMDRVRESWEDVHKGADRGSKTAILQDGLEFEPLSIPPEDAQFLETRKFQVDEIARIFRVPPHMLGSLERATFSNITEQSVEWSRSVIPWAQRWEQESTFKLLRKADLFTRMNLNSLLRGDIKTRYEAYAVGRQWGWLSPNDVLRLEDMNPIGEDGDVYLVPSNMTTLEKLTAEPEPVPAGLMPAVIEPEDEEDEEPDERMMPVFRDVIGRGVRREVAEVRKAAGRLELGKFRNWGAKFYTDHGVYLMESLKAPLEALLPGDAERRAEIQREVCSDVAAHLDMVVLAYESGDLEALCARWLQERATGTARLIMQMANGVAA